MGKMRESMDVGYVQRTVDQKDEKQKMEAAIGG